MKHVTLIAVASVMALLLSPFAGTSAAADKPVIHSQSDLPRYTYKLPTPTASALLTDPAFTGVADQVRSDIEKLLDSYTIEDKSTLRTLYTTLEGIALLTGKYDDALADADKVREFQDKPAERLMSGLVAHAIAAAEKAGGDMDARLATFRSTYADSVNALPWDVVQETVKQTKGRLGSSPGTFSSGSHRASLTPPRPRRTRSAGRWPMPSSACAR